LKQQARQAGEDIIDFGLGNPDGPAPPHVVDKLVQGIGHIGGLPEIPGRGDLREILNRPPDDVLPTWPCIEPTLETLQSSRGRLHLREGEGGARKLFCGRFQSHRQADRIGLKYFEHACQATCFGRREIERVDVEIAGIPRQGQLGLLATVVSVPEPGRAVVDAGSKVLSSDPLRPRSGGHGLVLGTGSRLARLSEEHGVIAVEPGDRFRVGDRVRVLPNHTCVVSNLRDRLWTARGDSVEGSFAVAARGRVE